MRRSIRVASAGNLYDWRAEFANHWVTGVAQSPDRGVRREVVKILRFPGHRR